ncbi:MAG TPA: Fe-S cluster assembly ATPase SufC [Patescibacteria group bacterium]
MKNILEIKNLKVNLKEENKQILKGINLEIKPGEVHALMGPNGAGKSTLAKVLFDHPSFELTDGRMIFDGREINALSTTERAQLGMFLAFQTPEELSGITVSSFLRSAYNALRKAHDPDFKEVRAFQFKKILEEKMAELKFNPEFADRYINEGFSGGEKKKAEILQLAVLEPKLAVLDEIDSGLDVDAMKLVSEGVNKLIKKGLSVLIVTHYQRILDYIKPDYVHVIIDGQIAETGGPELAKKLETEGFKLD